MRIIAGLLLIIGSFLGAIFFRNYSGTVISYPVLWYVIFFFSGLLGALLIYSSFKRKGTILKQSYDAEIEKLKSNAEKIELDFDRCEFRSGSYSHQVKDENMNAVELVAPAAISFGDSTVTEKVIQSSLTYTHSAGNTSEKYISQSFPFDQTTLKYYVLNHNITLYVSRFDRKKYFFELKR